MTEAKGDWAAGPGGCLYRFRDANQEELDALSPNRLSRFAERDFATKIRNLGCEYCVSSLKPESGERKDL